jgi:hypothetical protein
MASSRQTTLKHELAPGSLLVDCFIEAFNPGEFSPETSPVLGGGRLV